MNVPEDRGTLGIEYPCPLQRKRQLLQRFLPRVEVLGISRGSGMNRKRATAYEGGFVPGNAH
jgi:hypothetical protein